MLFPRKFDRVMQLIADNIACARGGRQVFAGLSFSLGESEALVVTGRNGAGKSSLLRLIAGLLRPTAGNLRLAGGPADATVSELIHYLGHQDPVKPPLSVAENLQFWTDYLGGKGNPAKALKAVGLGGLADLPAAYLSAGQKRRLSIARLVTVKRPIWLLDEPTSTLDTASQAGFVKLMRAHLRDGGMIVAASHGSIGLGVTKRLRLS